MSILIALEGVLKFGPKMIREGRILVDALQKTERRILYLGDDTVEASERWLAQNGLKGHAGVFTPAAALDDDEPLRQRQIAMARAMGHVDLVVDGDPETVAHCLEIGVPALLFAHPQSALPEWRPDTGVRAWGDITASLERRRQKEATDG